MTRSISPTADQGQSNSGDAALLDVRQVAARLGCSTRHVIRMADSGRMPRPLKLGALIRWRRDLLADWISNGCPSTREGGATR
jgi:excisionase family DNA binding protein